MGLSIGISIEWAELLSDGKFCRHCEEPIRGRMYQMEFITGDDRERLNYRICQPCYIRMNDDNDQTS